MFPTTIYVWETRILKASLGHASMQIGGDRQGSYVSLFPGGDGVWAKDYFNRSNVESAPQYNLAKDQLNEKRPPEFSVDLYGLDTVRMEAMWELLNRPPNQWNKLITGPLKEWNNTYHLKKFNCSTTVAFLLSQGGANKYVDYTVKWHWAPKDIKKWAKLLAEKIGNQQVVVKQKIVKGGAKAMF